MADSRVVIVKLAAGVEFERAAQTLALPAHLAPVAGTGGFADVVSRFPGVQVAPLFSASTDAPRREEPARAALPPSDAPPGAPDNPTRFLRLEARTEADARQLAVRLAPLAGVEVAYVEPVYELPLAIPIQMATGDLAPQHTPDFTSRQSYLEPSPTGLDVLYAWTLPTAGHGAGVSGADVEGGWILDHEDFDSHRLELIYGESSTDPIWLHHGTACLGEGVARLDSHGVSGIAPDTERVYCCSIFGMETSPAAAIDAAAARLQAGDVILVELHAPGPEATGIDQEGYIPIEYWEANYNAIRRATDRGIVVVAAAGNGGVDLDRAAYGRAFDRTFRDSGAILVGAGAPVDSTFGPDRSRLPFSNWGAAVDVQAHGHSVVTTAYGDLQHDADVRRWYTRRFSGTSSAAPIVWGAVLLLQSIARTIGPVLDPRRVRSLLRETGADQTDAPESPRTQRIGPRPDLRRALEVLGVPNV